MKKEIDSETILLRTIQQSDWKDILSYRSLPNIAQFQYWEPYTKEDALNFVNRCKNTDLNSKNEWIGLVVIQKTNGRIIGDCALKIEEETAEIGCNISPKYQKQGFAKTVILLLIAYCFHKNNISKVFGITDSKNTASIRLMESMGMAKDPLFEKTVECKRLLSIEYKYVIEKNKKMTS